MTLAEFKTQIEWEGKLEGETEGISKLDNIILESVIVLGQSHPEILLRTSTVVVPVSGNLGGFFELEDAMSIDRIDFFSGTNEAYEIPHRDQVVGPAPVEGKPKCYEVFRGGDDVTHLEIQLFPSAGIVNPTDSYVIWYKAVPVFASDSDTIPTPWIPFLKREVLARLAQYRSETSELQTAQLFKSGAQQALQVEVSNDSESLAPSN